MAGDEWLLFCDLTALLDGWVRSCCAKVEPFFMYREALMRCDVLLRAVTPPHLWCLQSTAD
jgi:hypothetical protein